MDEAGLSSSPDIDRPPDSLVSLVYDTDYVDGRGNPQSVDATDDTFQLPP